MNDTPEIVDKFLDKLQNLNCKQVNAALMYSQLLRETHFNRQVIQLADTELWSEINNAIIEKWSKSGLKKIKTLAWQLFENNHLTLE